MSASANEKQAEIDKRVNMLFSLGDVDIICDLRYINPARPTKYEQFQQKTEQYIENIAETAVHERRHEYITHIATATSVPHLLETVKQTSFPNGPVPSENWLRLQFRPKNPTTHAALQHRPPESEIYGATAAFTCTP